MSESYAIPMIYRLIIKEKYKISITDNKIKIYENLDLDTSILQKNNIVQVKDINDDYKILVLKYDSANNDSIIKLIKEKQVTTILLLNEPFKIQNLDIMVYSYHKSEKNKYLVISCDNLNTNR